MISTYPLPRARPTHLEGAGPSDPSTLHCRVRSRAGIARRSEPLTGLGNPTRSRERGWRRLQTAAPEPVWRPACRAQGRARAESRRKLDEIYTRFARLGERRHQLGTTLSGGEQQMLAMARVLVGAPKLLLIDEPTEGLAPKIVDEIFVLMEGLRRDGIPILLVEQNMQRAVGLTQRFYVLERGAVVLEGRGDHEPDRMALRRRLAV